MHFKMLSAICFNLDQSKSLSCGNVLGRDTPYLLVSWLSHNSNDTTFVPKPLLSLHVSEVRGEKNTRKYDTTWY